jgi:hypothetical protein
MVPSAQHLACWYCQVSQPLSSPAKELLFIFGIGFNGDMTGK